MFKMSELDKTNLDGEDFFDLEEMPDVEEDLDKDFVDIKKVKEEEKKVKEKEMMNLPKDQENFSDGKFKREGEQITLVFAIEKEDIQRITKMSFGLLSSNVQEGSYTFDIKENDQGIEELFYFDEFVGEIIEDDPRIYKRYFTMAVIRSMVAEGMLIEYEKNKFTIHPVFFLKIKMNSEKVAEGLVKKGFPIIDEEELAKIKERKAAEKEEKDKNKAGKDDDPVSEEPSAKEKAAALF